MAPGRHTLHLPPDLREAATTLRDYPDFQECLEDDIKRVRLRLGVESTAQGLEWVYRNSESLGFWRTPSRFSTRYEKDGPNTTASAQGAGAARLTPAEAFELLCGYWKNDRELSARLNAPFDRNLLAPEQPVVAPFPGANGVPTPRAPTHAAPHSTYPTAPSNAAPMPPTYPPTYAPMPPAAPTPSAAPEAPVPFDFT